MGALHSIKLIVGIVRDVLIIVFFLTLVYAIFAFISLFTQLQGMSLGIGG